jgi:hypothetical protein
MIYPEDVVPGDHLGPDERDPEASEADAFEQATVAGQEWHEPTVSNDIEAPEWDAREQSEVVPFDDDYR